MKNWLFLFYFLLPCITTAQTDEQLENMSKEELIELYKKLQNQKRHEHPSTGFEGLFREMSKRMQNMFNDPFLQGLEDDDFMSMGMGIGSQGPEIKNYRKGDQYIVEINTTNIDKSSLKLNIKNGMISISGKTRIDKKNEGSGSQSFMQYESSFSQSFPVPDGADEEKVDIKTEENKMILSFPPKKIGKVI